MIKGEVVYLYAFDVASEIVIGRVKDMAGGTPVPFEIRTDHTAPKDVPLYKPLALVHPPLSASLPGMQVRPRIHVYEVGVVSIAMRIAFEAEALSDLMPFHTVQLADGRRLEQAARELCIETCRSIEGAMVQSAQPTEPEAYTVFCLTETGDEQLLLDWAEACRREIAGLLTQNPPEYLSDMQVAEVLRVSRAYSNDDFVVLDWDAALVADRSGYVEDMLYVLELANLQLEEYRMMDQRLDRYLNTAYGHIQRGRRFGLFGSYSLVLRTLRTLRIDAARLNDEVTNITKFFGDWYLARVYVDARERFHLGHWKSSVEERLKQIDALYTVAHAELTNRRMVWLETLIVLFFAIDLLAIFFWKG